MKTPTIIIGIGTSGMKIIENIQRFCYENYGLNKPKNLEYIYLETDEKSMPEGTPAGDDAIKRVYISLDNMAEMIANLKETCDNPSWLPNSSDVLAAGKGAGGIRSCGRLALWGINNTNDNFTNVIEAIRNAHSNVMHMINDDVNEEKKPTVYMVGSLTGGTGSGIFIDMAYIVRDIISGIKNLYGLFLLPPKPANMNGKEMMYGNSYGAIKDLEYYNQPENTYSAKWPSRFVKNEEQPPYELVQFISQDYLDGTPAISNLGGLYKMAGLYLFLNIAGIDEKRGARLIDAKSNGDIDKYGTFGLSAIQFPKGQIQDYIASQLSIDLLQRLTDSHEYFFNGQQYQINRAIIKQQMDKEFGSILENAFNTLNTVSNEDLLISIDKDATNINTGNISGNPVEFIISMFSSTKTDNYHAKVNDNIKEAEKVFIDNIYQQVDNALQQTENLYYAKATLEDLVESIDKTLKYWQSIGISSQAQNWDNTLRELAKGCIKNTYKIVLEQDAVVKDRLITIFEMMKMHLSVRTLVDICNHIKDGKIKLEGNRHELPILKFFDDLINKLNALIGKTEEVDNSNINSFIRNLKAIEGDINDTTLPILRVYPSNSFKEECNKAKSTYNQRVGSNVRSMKDIIQQRNILTYFKEQHSNNELYLDFLKSFRMRVNESNCIEDFNIDTYIIGHIRECMRTANKATLPFLKLKERVTFRQSPYLPRFIIGDDVNELTKVLVAFAKENNTNYPDTPNGKVEIENLKNIIVFYDEKGKYIPITDLSYIELMKEVYEKSADPNKTDAKWKKERSAYTTN